MALTPKANRDDMAEYLYEKINQHGLNPSGVEVHEVTDPNKSGNGSTWLGIYAQSPLFQADIRVYGTSCFLFQVWRPGVGSRTVMLKTLRDAERLIEESMVQGLWTGKMAS